MSGPNRNQRFEDRTDAGSRLAQALVDRGVDVDIVLAIPRGGLPLGRAVADALAVPLDVVVASKIGAPRNPEFAIGAVGSDGSVWLDDETISLLGVEQSYIDDEREREAAAARAKADRYRGDHPAPDLAGKTVVIVDDGVATGSTAIAATRLVRAQEAERTILAVPVGPPDTVAELEDVADAVVCLHQPDQFQAVGQYYRNFTQISDEEAMGYLAFDPTEPPE